MAWFSRFTRFGDVHAVFGQEREISCGIACVIMAAFKINKLKPGGRAFFDENDVIANATRLFGPNPLGTQGLNNPQMLQLLNDATYRMSGWRFGRHTPTAIPDKLMKEVGVVRGVGPTVDVSPVIVGVDWNRGGGHWVLVDTVREFMGDTYATVCDPWDANVHIVPLKSGSTFDYTGQDAMGVDLWGTRYRYNKPLKGGSFLGDMLWRV